MSSHDSWLVKSSGRVLGPFTLATITELLKTREITLLDEVSAPLRRWQTIQYHEDLGDVVDQVRRASLSDKTEGNWTPTNTSGLTQTLTDVADGDLTAEMTSSGLTGFTQTNKEIVIHNVTEQARIPSPALGSSRYQTAERQNTAIQHQVEKTTRTLWVVTALILVAVTVFIVQKRINDPTPVKPTVTTLKQEVVAEVQVGNYNEALRRLKSYYSDPAQSGELAIYYGALLIQVEGQTLVGRRLLNNVIAAQRPEIKQAYAGLGVADLIDNQLDSAQENFTKALLADPGYNPALINRAIVALQKGDYTDAKNLAMRSIGSGLVQAEAVLTLAEAELYNFKNSRNVGSLNSAAKEIKEFRSSQWDYAPELDFYTLYFDFLKHEKMMDEKLGVYLDQDPQLSQDHRHSLFIYRGRFQWRILARLCEQMGEKLADTPRTATFIASCYAREGRWDQARTMIEKAVQQSPKDPLVQAWYSYILKESGDADQASVVLGRAAEFNRRGEFVLPTLLQARFCFQLGDLECAHKSWQKIYEKDTERLSAISGIAWVYAQKGAQSEALQYMNRGLKISPDYIPLLTLRQKAEKEGWYAAN